MLNRASMDRARLLYYGLLSKFFIFKTDKSKYEDIGDMLAYIKTNPLNDDVFLAVDKLLNSIDTQGYEILIDEYDAIFHGFGNRAIAKSASFYEEGIEFGKKCIQTREFLAKTTIRRDEQNYKDPEDSVGFLFVFMYELIKNTIEGNREYENIQHCLFAEIINPFIDQFIEELFGHLGAKNYKDIAIIMGAFMEFERLYFEVEKVQLQDKKRKTQDGISAAEAKRRAINKAKKEMDRENLNLCEI